MYVYAQEEDKEQLQLPCRCSSRTDQWPKPRSFTKSVVGGGKKEDTLHPTPYTLHPTPYTLHPTPYTLHPKRNMEYSICRDTATAWAASAQSCAIMRNHALLQGVGLSALLRVAERCPGAGRCLCLTSSVTSTSCSCCLCLAFSRHPLLAHFVCVSLCARRDSGVDGAVYAGSARALVSSSSCARGFFGACMACVRVLCADVQHVQQI